MAKERFSSLFGITKPNQLKTNLKFKTYPTIYSKIIGIKIY